ncbi:MAG: hypothetical protein NTY64_22065 [Deltaproteobacteria bacterium]|nr:hypothetical protein [Deltaproteobacteria bacterium]
MRKKFIGVILPVFWVAFFSGAAIGQHGHDHGSMSPAAPKTSHEMPMKNQFGQTTTVEGYKISFDVMDMSAHMSMPGMKGMQHGGGAQNQSHVIMVGIQDEASKEIISDARVNFTVLSPSGNQEAGKMEWSGDHYGGGFSPKGKGAYQVLLKIEAGGMEREAKFTYESK